ncbi:MAG: hypothetical protein WD669_01145 [Pirellulales bacterium]
MLLLVALTVLGGSTARRMWALEENGPASEPAVAESSESSEEWSPYPSESWSPHPSEPWSPPATGLADIEQPQSYFMPSLGRFGVVAPQMPGVESVHSPFVMGPAPWGAATFGPSLFPAPSCRGPECSQLTTYSSGDFSPDTLFDEQAYEACPEQSIYGSKYLNPTERPLVELGVPFYLGGPVPPPSLDCGVTNPSLPRFYLYGDYRAAAAYNKQNGRDLGVLAHRINLEWDLALTATERFHMSTGPFQEGNNFMRFEFDDGRGDFVNELDFFDADTDSLFFEGDLGYMLGGWTGRYAPFDAPIAIGLIPLLFQNGVWMEDAFVGAAMTIPARNSPWLDWSNYDVTFFAGVDQITSPAFAGSNAAANVFGATTFIEAKGGYIEAGYAFLDDTTALDRSYHNLGLSYTRRYLNLVSNSLRVIVNAGQEGPQSERTADGVLLLAENSFLTPWPYNVIPYVNMFVGFDDPQSVARAGAAGGVLRNTGILFESDNLTGYPTLDATGNDVYGAAFGVDLLSPEFNRQLILEAAVLQTFGDSATRNAPGDEYGVGLRYQVPITNAHLLRFDVMHGWFDGADDVSGARVEFRWKF